MSGGQGEGGRPRRAHFCSLLVVVVVCLPRSPHYSSCVVRTDSLSIRHSLISQFRILALTMRTARSTRTTASTRRQTARLNISFRSFQPVYDLLEEKHGEFVDGSPSDLMIVTGVGAVHVSSSGCETGDGDAGSVPTHRPSTDHYTRNDEIEDTHPSSVRSCAMRAAPRC